MLEFFVIVKELLIIFFFYGLTLLLCYGMARFLIWLVDD